MENELIDVAAEEDEAIADLRALWTRGNAANFDFCKRLHVITVKKQAAKKSLQVFYKEIGLSARHAQRLKMVGDVFRHIKSDQVVAYSSSHLTRMAAMPEIGMYIIEHQFKIVVADLDYIASAKNDFHPSHFDMPEDFLKLLRLLKTADRLSQRESDKNVDGVQNQSANASNEKLERTKDPIILKCKKLREQCDITLGKLSLIEDIFEALQAEADESEISLSQYLDGYYNLDIFEADFLDQAAARIEQVEEMVFRRKVRRLDYEFDGFSSRRAGPIFDSNI